MRFHVGRIDDQYVGATTLIRKSEAHFCEDALLTPPLSATVKCLVRPVFLRRISPSQDIAIDEENAAQNPPVVNKRLAMGLREKGSSLANCAALSQYKSRVPPPRFAQMRQTPKRRSTHPDP